MKVLQVGLGSMGRRRIRCLQSLTSADLVGFDPRADRRSKAAAELQVPTVSTLDEALWATLDAAVISTPPHVHYGYLSTAVDHGVAAFVEVGVPLPGYEGLVARAERSGCLVAPSCTLYFHPAVRLIREIVDSGRYGRATTFSYYMGQYLPDWHPWEDVRDFYVSRRDTSGTREMASFELIWLTHLLGFPVRGAGLTGRTVEMGVDIDDTYAFLLDGGSWIGTVLIDVVARFALRQLVLNLEAAQVRWSWEEPCIRLFEVDEGAWRTLEFPPPISAPGYNPNIGERMYLDEMTAFLGALDDGPPFPHSLQEDLRVRSTLRRLEEHSVYSNLSQSPSSASEP